MNTAEDCLRYLQDRNWIKLNNILSKNKSAQNIAESPIFSIFETVFIDELKRHESETNEDHQAVATRILQLHKSNDSALVLSETALKKIARYLFNKNPDRKYAELLGNDSDAQLFLKNEAKVIEENITNSRIGANLNVKIGEDGKLKFNKDIFNESPQEKELFFAAKSILPDKILLPNAALSTIINSKVCSRLDKETISFFYKSTLDLCIVNPTTFRSEIFIELDSSWHDQQKNIANDTMKDLIFREAGLKLHRLRKKENKKMIEIFELFINSINPV